MLKNAIVCMFDSLQFNYLGCYGNEWIKTPNMDKMSREGVLFENCYTEGLPTIPCRRAMHTGRYTLGVTGWSPLRMEDTTIADLCWGRPIDTALIFDCPMYRQPKFGYTRGFDKVFFTHGHEMDHYFYSEDPLIHYKAEDFIIESCFEGGRKQLGDVTAQAQHEEVTCYLKQMQHWNSEEDRYVVKTMRKAVEYLHQVDRNKQFYLWVDSFDPHEPWNPPSTYMPDVVCPYDTDYKGKAEFLPFMGHCDGIYTEEETYHIRMLYAELVTVCDTAFGYLLDAVRELGFEENTLIMLVSDHGEPMGYGEHGHGIMRKCRPWPYEELSHTPMLLKAPGIKAGQRIKSFVQSIDVAPTICDWLGIGVHPDMQGFSLLPLCYGEVEQVRDFAISGYDKGSWSIYTEDWCYIHWVANDDDDPLKSDTLIAMAKALQSVGFKGKVGGNDLSKIDLSALENPLDRHKAAATIDGADQWTCTPGAAMEVPEKDELYYRKEDPFQLNNVISKHPDKAKELFDILRGKMSEIRAS